MITTIIFDFSRVLLFPKDKKYTKGLNPLHAQLSKNSDYNFLDNFEFNEELLIFLKGIKEKYALYVLTSGIIQNTPEARRRINPIFRTIYSAKDIGLNKKDPQIYIFITNKLNKKPEEILLIDDTIDNILTAQKGGLKTLHFKSNEQFFIEIQKLLSEKKRN